MTSKRQRERGYLLPEHITGHDLICVSMMIPNDEYYKAAFFGAITELQKWWNWDKSGNPNDKRALQAASYWRDLIYRHYKVGDCGFDDDRNKCEDYPTNSKIIEYAPQDPYLEPGLVPEGYVAPAWGVVGQSILNIVGLQSTDVITGWTGLPVLTPALYQGLARFRVRAKGSGTIALHLLAIPFGGSVLIVPDGTLNPSKWVFLELERDLAGIPPETVTEIIQQFTFDDGGEHYLDVSFMPRFNDSITFLGYGGGLRKVVLCGMRPIDAPEHVEQAPRNTSGVEIEEMARFRVKPDDCTILQIECSPDEWTDFYNPLACTDGSTQQPGPTPDLQPGQCKTHKVELAGNQKWRLPFPVKAGYTITITDVKGGWNDGGRIGYWCPNGQDYVLNACIGSGDLVGDDPAPTIAHMRLIYSIGTGFHDGFNTQHTVQAGQEDAEVMFQANDSDIANNFGSITFTVTVCAALESAFVTENLTINVATASPVTMAQQTKATKVYKITLSGTAQVGIELGSPLLGDAFWRQVSVGSAYNQSDVQVWINGAAFGTTPAAEASHIYEITKQGDGAAWSFFLHDGQYNDNTGSLAVKIEEL